MIDTRDIIKETFDGTAFTRILGDAEDTFAIDGQPVDARTFHRKMRQAMAREELAGYVLRY